MCSHRKHFARFTFNLPLPEVVLECIALGHFLFNKKHVKQFLNYSRTPFFPLAPSLVASLFCNRRNQWKAFQLALVIRARSFLLLFDFYWCAAGRIRETKDSPIRHDTQLGNGERCYQVLYGFFLIRSSIFILLCVCWCSPSVCTPLQLECMKYKWVILPFSSWKTFRISWLQVLLPSFKLLNEWMAYWNCFLLF
jgi:hypothetical protein